MSLLLKIDPARPDPGKMAEAVRILKGGGVVAFPTETFYGLGVDARNEEAVERIFRIKGRDFNKPVALIVAEERDVAPLAEEIPMTAKNLMQRFWPGPLTILFRATPAVSNRLTGGTGKIGIRIPGHPIARLLAAGITGPLRLPAPTCPAARIARQRMPSCKPWATFRMQSSTGGPRPGKPARPSLTPQPSPSAFSGKAPSPLA